MKIELIDQIKVQNELGEGVIWDHDTQCIWWTDIEQCMLFQYNPIKQHLESWATPERLSCFSPVTGRKGFVAAFASGFAFYEPREQQMKWIEKIEQDNPGTRMNDGRTDRQGRFWAGSMVEDTNTATSKGKLYCLDNNLNISSQINDLTIPNSLCWSPDSNILYHCDSPNQRIDQYAYEPATGRLGARALFAKTEHNCYPDGSVRT